MNSELAEDRAFCLAGVARYGSRFDAILEILSPDRRRHIAAVIDELRAMDAEGHKAMWQRFGNEIYERGTQLAQRQLGVALDDLPTLLRDLILKNGNENH